MTAHDNKETPTTNTDESLDMRTDRFTWHLEDVDIYNSVDDIPNFRPFSVENLQPHDTIEDDILEAEIVEAKAPKIEDAIRRYHTEFKATRSISDSDL
jgi:hypothetical protein